MPRSKSIIILAAGLGRRFGGTHHKSLVPLLAGEGSLSRLLRQLLLLTPQTKICVVVGHRAQALEAATRALSPTITCVGDARLANGSPLSSLVAGLEGLSRDPRAQDALVLFADTLYHPQALERLLASDPDQLLVASQPVGSSASGHLIGLRVDPDTRRLLALGPEEPLSQGAMAPAVCWPRPLWPSLAEAAARGLALQWQVIREQLPHTPVQVLSLLPDHTSDIDTPDDVSKARQILVSPLVLAAFRRTVSKDERNLGQPDQMVGDGFLKVCQSPDHAAIEASALRWLQATSEGVVPAVRDTRGPRLLLEPVRGIRLYDLLRLLRDMERLHPARAAQASAAALLLLRRNLQQVVQLQRALLVWPAAAQRPAYPLASHVAGLLAILVRLLGLPPLDSAECRELHRLRVRWEATEVLIPFRDATTKNTLVAIPELAPNPGLHPEDRLVRLLVWLDQGQCDSVRLVAFDFTSVVHRTAPEDDLFSLLAHAGSLPVSRRLPAELVPGVSDWPIAVAHLVSRIHPNIQPDLERAARALLVRDLRFGGRKLLYRLLNPAAFAVRFRYDDPAVYFARLPDALNRLDPNFAASFPLLMARLLQLRQAITLLPPWCASEASHDLYRTQLGSPIPYWQESPLELPPPTTAGGGGGR